MGHVMACLKQKWVDTVLEGPSRYLELEQGQRWEPANTSQEQSVCKDQDTRCAGNASGWAGTQMPDDKRGACKSRPAGPGGRKRWSPAAGSLVEGETGSLKTEVARGGGGGLKESPGEEWRAVIPLTCLCRMWTPGE